MSPRIHETAELEPRSEAKMPPRHWDEPEVSGPMLKSAGSTSYVMPLNVSVSCEWAGASTSVSIDGR